MWQTCHWSTLRIFFYVHGSVHRKKMSIIVQQDATIYHLLFPATCSLQFVGNNKLHIVASWYVFVRTSLHMRREEKPTGRHWMVYFTYNMLNVFRGLLCPPSGAQHYMCVITTYGVQCLGCWLSEVRCRAAGYASRLRDVARLVVQHISSWTHTLLPCTWPPTTSNQALHTIGGKNTHIV